MAGFGSSFTGAGASAGTGSEESLRRFRGPSSSWLAAGAGFDDEDDVCGSRSQECCHWHPGLVQASPDGQGMVLKFRSTASIASILPAVVNDLTRLKGCEGLDGD